MESISQSWSRVNFKKSKSNYNILQQENRFNNFWDIPHNVENHSFVVVFVEYIGIVGLALKGSDADWIFGSVRRTTLTVTTLRSITQTELVDTTVRIRPKNLRKINFWGDFFSFCKTPLNLTFYKKRGWKLNLSE